ncbi:M36 family metallopeptidase, partial [Myxococcota bacterium]|nr:M36 family metallopeptidase [Myxococcota bacterium]
DPISTPALEEVTLPMTTSANGALSNAYVEVFNCLNEPGGVVVEQAGGMPITLSLCHEIPTARPNGEGHYTHIAPPPDDLDPNDPFAELMMYYHVNAVHDFFKGRFEHAGMDKALPAVVNVQLKLDPPLSIAGFEPGPDGWYAFPNAAYFPAETWDMLAELGFPPRETDMILFGQAEADFAYDARVIYHEYTHAVIGTGRLQGYALDRYGLDNSPLSMNEGLADYFAAALAEAPEMGVYGIGVMAPEQVRDLSVPKRCPEDLVDEIHDNGRIFSSAMWTLRQAIGAEADDIMFDALEQFGVQTTHDEAVALVLAKAALRGHEAEAEAAFEAHGLIGCLRIQPFTDFDAEAAGLPYIIEGTATAGIMGLALIPAYKQLRYDIPEGATEATLSWRITAGMMLPGLGGGAAAPLTVALRRGQPVELDARGERVADLELTPTLEGGEQQITLDASCLSGEGGAWYVLFLSGAEDQTWITQTRLDAAPTAEPIRCAAAK